MSRFLKHIHYLRGVAIVMIVGVHARGYSWEWTDQTGFDFFVTLFDNGTILFVFIAGFLFQYLNHDRFQYIPYLKQKARFVVLPYLIFSMPILVLRLYLGSGDLPLAQTFDQHSILYRMGFYLVTGLHMVPFWFMPMIFLFYLSSFLLHKLDHKTFYTFVFPLVLVSGLFTYRPENNANPFLSYLHFLPVYITGMWASHYQNRIINYSKLLLNVLLAFYLLITVLELTDAITLDKHLSMQQVWVNKEFVFNIYVLKALVLCFVLVIIFNLSSRFNSKLLNGLAECSFGIYFIHFYYISSFRVIFSPLAFSVFSFISYYILLIALSWASIYTIKRLTGKYSRYLTGS